jgi:hypothetical protein
LKKQGLLSWLKLRRTLSFSGWPEFDYPLVERDIPSDPDARHLAELVAAHDKNEWRDTLAMALGYALRKSESLMRGKGQRQRAQGLRQLASSCAEENSDLLRGRGCDDVIKSR